MTSERPGKRSSEGPHAVPPSFAQLAMGCSNPTCFLGGEFGGPTRHDSTCILLYRRTTQYTRLYPSNHPASLNGRHRIKVPDGRLWVNGPLERLWFSVATAAVMYGQWTKLTADQPRGKNLSHDNNTPPPTPPSLKAKKKNQGYKYKVEYMVEIHL